MSRSTPCLTTPQRIRARSPSATGFWFHSVAARWSAWSPELPTIPTCRRGASSRCFRFSATPRPCPAKSSGCCDSAPTITITLWARSFSTPCPSRCARPSRLRRAKAAGYRLTEAGLALETDALPARAIVKRKLLQSLKQAGTLARSDIAALSPSAPQATQGIYGAGLGGRKRRNRRASAPPPAPDGSRICRPCPH